MSKRIQTYILGALIIAFGLIFVLSPTDTFETIVVLAGVMIILYSIIKILLAFKSENPYSAYSITGSLVGVLFGFILISNKEQAIKVIPVLLGIYLLTTGITSLLFLVKAKSDNSLIVRPISKIILGAISFIVPVIPVIATGIVVGIILILSGISIIINQKDEEVIYKVKVKK